MLQCAIPAAAWQGQRWPLALLLSTAPGGDPAPWGASPSRFPGIRDDLRVSAMLGAVLSRHRVVIPCCSGEPTSDWAAGHQTVGNLGSDSFWRVPKEGKPSWSSHIHLCKFGGWEVNCSCLFCGCTMDLTAGGSFPVLSTFSFLSVSRTATGASSEVADAKSCVAPVGTFPATFRAQHVQPPG